MMTLELKNNQREYFGLDPIEKQSCIASQEISKNLIVFCNFQSDFEYNYSDSK
jgi:hypothetical protein